MNLAEGQSTGSWGSMSGQGREGIREEQSCRGEKMRGLRAAGEKSGLQGRGEVPCVVSAVFPAPCAQVPSSLPSAQGGPAESQK